MRKPSYTYNEFKTVWTDLLKNNRATLDNTVAVLGGHKGTASKYRTQYELEQKEDVFTFINEVELPKAIAEALAHLNVKKVKALEETIVKLKKHLIDAELSIEDLTKQLEKTQDSEQSQKEALKAYSLKYEKAIAALEARLSERENKEQQLNTEMNTLRTQLAEATTSAAVATKEVELLQQQLKARR